MADYIDRTYGAGGYLSKGKADYRPREGQIALARAVDRCFAERRPTMAEGPCGCHAAGQLILLFDGSIKKVEDIVVGDRLMGDDSTPRTVLSLARGTQEMVDIVPIKGEPWRVNLDHMLTLVRLDTGKVCDVSVRDWIGWSNNQKNLHKLFRVGVQVFANEQESLPLDPYLLGVILGDGCITGTCGGVSVSKPDQEMVDFLKRAMEPLGLHVRTMPDGKTQRLAGEIGNKHHPVITPLRNLGLWGASSGTKFVPAIYKTGSRETRLQMLAGLLDTDGSLVSFNGYDYISKSKQLAEDVLFLARSLGYAAYCKVAWKQCQTGAGDFYHRVSISGDTHEIPCILPRKKAQPRKQIKDVLRTGFQVVPTHTVEPYYGFSLDGNGRFLLGDFTVTHNTGKGLAYLVPAIVHALAQNTRVVISTASNALLDQLARGENSELATLSRLLPRPFRYATLKGRSNYLCHKQLETWGDDADLLKNSSAKRLRVWVDSTQSGDRGEAPELEAKEHWRSVSSGPEDCTKPGCIYSKYDPEERNNAPLCFAEQARITAKGAHVIVTNHHYLATHLKNDYLVLPEFGLLVIDEAHEFPDIFRQFWGQEEHAYGLRAVVAYARMMEQDASLPKSTADTLEQQWKNLFDHLTNLTLDPVKIALKRPQNPERKHLLTKAITWDDTTLREAMKRTTDLAHKVAESIKQGPSAEGLEDAVKCLRHADKAITSLDALKTESPENMARWVEVTPRGTVVCHQPIEVGGLLRKVLFEKYPATVLTSATLTVGGTFNFFRGEIGLDPYSIALANAASETKAMVPAATEAPAAKASPRVILQTPAELAVDSPFDHRRQCLLVLPANLPDPSKDDKEWMLHMMEAGQRTIDACNGRTLWLFTSRHRMELTSAWLRQIMPKRTILVQGEQSPRALAAQFEREPETVLCGTRSFWTGLNIPGESLSAVVIDRLPTPQQEPVLEAMKLRMGGAYWDYLFSKGALLFRQGCGRLIRTITDTGVIVICDPRITTKRYGATYLRSLPTMQMSTDLNDIAPFLVKARAWAKRTVPEASGAVLSLVR